MKMIVTLQNDEGSFDECGMNNRMLVSGYLTVRNAFKFAVKPYAKGRACRVEIWPSGNIYTPCNWVNYYDAEFNRIYTYK